MFVLALSAISLAAINVACGTSSSIRMPDAAKDVFRKEEPPKPLEFAKPFDESRRFPSQNQVKMELIPEHILGKSFLPGGNLATYKKGKSEFQVFLVKGATPDAAALMLLDFRKQMDSPKLIPHFGGYYGSDSAKTVFVFPKNSYLAGIIGLTEKDADAFARTFAARIP
jgi:hypothetical protein